MAEILNIHPDELVILWLAVQIYEVVKDEYTALKAMMVAEESVKHLNKEKE